MKAFGTLVISHIFNTHGKCDNFVIQRVKNLRFWLSLKSMVLGTFFRLFVIISCQGMFCSISRHRFPRNFHEYLAIWASKPKGKLANCYVFASKMSFFPKFSAVSTTIFGVILKSPTRLAMPGMSAKEDSVHRWQRCKQINKVLLKSDVFVWKMDANLERLLTKGHSAW